MKIKTIINLCKEKKRMHIFEGENEQWISDGFAIYPLFGLPRMDEKTICTAYDIDEKKAAKIIFRHSDALPDEFDFSDWPEKSEYPAEEMQPYLLSGGAVLVPFMTSQGVRFVDRKYFAPFSDTDIGMIQI